MDATLGATEENGLDQQQERPSQTEEGSTTNGPAQHSSISQLPAIIRRTEERIKQHEDEAERERAILIELRRYRELVAGMDNCEPSGTFHQQVVNDHYSRDDFSSMPLCSERSLRVLLFYVSQHVTVRSVVSPYHSVSPSQVEREIDKEFVHLKERLRLEELESEAMDSLVKTAMISTRNRNWNSVVSTLKQILRQINPLNMRELFRLVEEIDETACLLKGKDVILFLGETGVGKSTTVHFLAGSKLVPAVVEGLHHLRPESIKNPEARKILTSPGSQSTTQCVASVTIDLREMGVFTKESIVLCDTPGVADTRRAEVDIANGVSIARAIRECRSVKPVVVISYRGIGDRLSGLKSLSHALTRMMPNIRDYIRSFSYLFTKFPPNETDKIHPLLTEAIRTGNERDPLDPGSVALLEDMEAKTRSDAHTLDPLTDDPSELLYELTVSPCIDHPENVFQPVISDRSRALVREQVRKHQLTIICATRRADYPLVKYKLDQLKQLIDLLDDECIKQSYTDSLRHLREHLSKEYHEATSSIHRCLMLRPKEIQHYQTCIAHATEVEQLLDNHLGKDLVPSERFVEHLQREVDAIVTDLREKDIDSSSLKVELDKLQLLSTSFPDLEAQYQQICEFLAKKLESVIESFKSSVSLNQFDTIASDMTKLRVALTTLQRHLPRISTEAEYLLLKDYFLQHLKDSVEKMIELLIQTKLDQNDVDRMHSCVSTLENAKNTPDLHSHIPKEEIVRILEGLVSSIVRYFEEIVEKTRGRLESEKTLHTSEEWLTMLQAIRTISTVEHRTNRSYSRLWESIISYLSESSRDVEELLRSVSRLEGRGSEERLTKSLASLTSVQWIEKYRPGVYSNVIQTVEKRLIACLVEMKESVIEKSLDLDQFEKIESAARTVRKMEWLTQFTNIAPDIRQHFVETNAWLETEISRVLASIQEAFNKEKWEKLAYRTVDWNRAEKAFRYLDACQNTRLPFSRNPTVVASALQEFLVGYHRCIEQEMKLCLNTIKQYPTKSKDEGLGQARLLCSRWQELLEIKPTCSRVFSYFPKQPLIEHWQNELSTYLSDITDELYLFSVTLQTKALLEKLVVLKVLSLFDRFLTGEKYSPVYTKYQKISFTQTRATREEITKAIENHDYGAVHDRMRRLELSGEIGEYFSGQARRALNVAMGNLLEETRSRGLLLKPNLDISEVKLLVENLKRIDRAQQCLSNYLDRPEDLGECIAYVKTLIEHRMQHCLEKIKALISIHSFRQAEEDLASMGLIHRLLGRYCTEEISVCIRAMKDNPRQTLSDDVTERYAAMDISDYFLYPPIDILCKLEEASCTDPIYREAMHTVRETVADKLMQELEMAQASNSSYIHLRRFETAVKYLPQTMREALEVALKHFREDLNLIQDGKEMNIVPLHMPSYRVTSSRVSLPARNPLSSLKLVTLLRRYTLSCHFTLKCPRTVWTFCHELNFCSFFVGVVILVLCTKLFFFSWK